MEIGLYGKLPTHGDFLRRRVADDFVHAWDTWLQQCIVASRAALGEPWLETYLTSPVWRFAFGPNVCGASPVAGLLVPSVDRVGRNFPLTLVWTIPDDVSTLEVALCFQQGFERAEQLLLDALAEDQLDFAEFDQRVTGLAEYFEAPDSGNALRLTPRAARTVLGQLARPQCIPVSAASALHGSAIQLLGSQLDLDEGALALWWTDGSAAVAPSWLMTRGLPAPESYSALLDGGWQTAGWDVAETEPDFSATMARPALDVWALVLTSAGSTDRGPVRPTNQDAFLERPERGLWAVADGMGGFSDGEVASRMVCDALVDMPNLAGLDEQIEAVIGQLREVNAFLRRTAERLGKSVHSGSTAVVLIIRNKECAVLWAGDSRAYRFRDGLLSQMTTDHGDADTITRAVGGEDSLELDVVRSDVRPHDRYLLCSDGVCRSLDIDKLRQILQRGQPDAVCAALIAQALFHGSTDNVTAVVVDCTASATMAPAAADGIDSRSDR